MATDLENTDDSSRNEIDECLADGVYTPPEVMAEIRCGSTKFWSLLREGKLSYTKVGGSTLVSKRDVQALLRERLVLREDQGLSDQGACR